MRTALLLHQGAGFVGAVEVAEALEQVGSILGQAGGQRGLAAPVRDPRLSEPTVRHDGTRASRRRELLGRVEAGLSGGQIAMRHGDLADVFAYVGFSHTVL